MTGTLTLSLAPTLALALTEQALAIFDAHLWAGVDLGEPEAQINALGLLSRLHARKVPALAERWASVMDGIEAHGPSDFLHAYPLHNLLRLYGLCVTARDTAPLLAGLAAAAADGEDSSPLLGRTVLPLARAIVALVRDDDPSAAASIRALRGDGAWACVAGSEEQRGFLLELAEGPVRAGKPVG